MRLADRDRCHVCHRRAARAALKHPCRCCAQLRHLRPSGICAGCARAEAPRRAPKLITCVRCAERRRNTGHGLCNRCQLANPDRPFRYGASLGERLTITPHWWEGFTAFVAAHNHPNGAVALLRELGRLLDAHPGCAPGQLLSRHAESEGHDRPLSRALASFFTSHGLAFPADDAQRRANARRRRYLDAIPAAMRAATAEFNQTQLHSQERSRRIGARPASDITIETKLRILRDLANHLVDTRQVINWAEVTTADLESFLAQTPRARHQQTYLLRGFFAWAKHRRLLLVDPARPLRLGTQPGFTGVLLDTRAQRELLRRWTDSRTHPHERLAGLLALLHAASNQEIRTLTVDDIDHQRQTVTLWKRPFPTPLDPSTWTALQTCIAHRQSLNTLNQHLIVTAVTRTRATAADSSYLTRQLAHAATTPSTCRQTRIAQLVTDLDPKLAATALGMQDSGLVRYLADNVDRDRLEPSLPRRC